MNIIEPRRAAWREITLGSHVWASFGDHLRDLVELRESGSSSRARRGPQLSTIDK
jgi:hypothetical protein